MQFPSWSSGRLSGGGCLNYPLYLPGRTRDVAALFLRGDKAGAVAALEKMAALGSQDAKTVLAFMWLQGAFPPAVDLDRAGELVSNQPAAGDSYALYVKGWVHFLRDRNAMRAVACWIAGAEKGFSPSVLELGRFLSWDLPGRPPEFERSIARLKQADSLGHKQAAALIAHLDAGGVRGPVFAATAKPRKAFQLCRMYFGLRNDFFSSSVFSRPLQQNRPFFREVSGSP